MSSPFGKCQIIVAKPLITLYDHSSFLGRLLSSSVLSLKKKQMKSLLAFLPLFLCLQLHAQDITGTWNGKLSIQGSELRIVFHIEETENGLITKMDSPDQGAKDIPTDQTSFKDNTLTIKAAAMGMTYQGKYNAEGNKIEGVFQQGPGSLPLTLSRKAIEKPSRPQDPTDFPYEQEEVSVENGDHLLAGTLTLPKGKTPSQIVVLVSGSGPQNRNEEVNAYNHRPFLVLSDYLTRQGIGVLRYDDRGVGESTGDFASATTADFASDAAAMITYLQTRKDLAKAKIGIAGHSEGGMIAPVVASQLKDQVDFLVLLAGPGIPIDELMLLQAQKLSETGGVPADIIEANQKALKKAYNYIKENESMSAEALRPGLEEIFKTSLDDFPEMVRMSIPDVDAFAQKEADELLRPWFLYFIRFNPDDYLSKINVPVYALNGTLDLQVTAEENLKGIEVSLAKANNKKVKIEAMEGLNHLFQKATTGMPNEYGQIEETFNEAAMRKIASWILQQ